MLDGCRSQVLDWSQDGNFSPTPTDPEQCGPCTPQGWALSPGTAEAWEQQLQPALGTKLFWNKQLCLGEDI